MASVAIVTCNTLGDGLLYMTLAHNLQLMGYEPVVYSNMLAQLSDWFPAKTILPYPDKSQAEAVLAQYDTVIADGACFLTECDEEHYSLLAKRYIFMKMASFNQALVAAHNGLLGKLAGVIVPKQNSKASMAENMKNICQQILGFDGATKENGLQPLKSLQFQKNSRRVVIHPESGNPIKNWPEEKFLRLAAALKAKAYQPAFIASPNEREKWQALVNGQFDLPLFPSLSDAAAYIYESGLMVGNDSGIGHLASCLGIFTCTIHRKKDPYYRWRPGWGDCQLVLPCWTFKWCGQLYWRPFLSVKRVLAALYSHFS